jgi:hypothetical protein
MILEWYQTYFKVGKWKFCVSMFRVWGGENYPSTVLVCLKAMHSSSAHFPSHTQLPQVRFSSVKSCAKVRFVQLWISMGMLDLD